MRSLLVVACLVLHAASGHAEPEQRPLSPQNSLDCLLAAEAAVDRKPGPERFLLQIDSIKRLADRFAYILAIDLRLQLPEAPPVNGREFVLLLDEFARAPGRLEFVRSQLENDQRAHETFLAACLLVTAERLEKQVARRPAAPP